MDTEKQKAKVYRAVDPAGGIHKRKTHRLYTHTVVYQRDEQADIANARHASWVATDKRNFEYHLKTLAGEQPRYYTDAAWKNYQEQVRGWVGTCTTPAEYHAKQERERLDRIAKDKREGYYERWNNAGFCGSYDLALKLAGSKRGDRCRNVTILPVEVA